MKCLVFCSAILVTSASAHAQIAGPVAPPASASGGSAIRAHGGVDVDRLELRRLIEAGEDPCWNAPPAPVPPAGGAHYWQTPPLTTQWKPCFPASGGLTVDAQIAVSSTRVVVTSQTRMGFYEKSGSYLGSITAKQLFSALGLDNGTPDAVNQYKDLRAVYDSYRNRFWLQATGLTRNQPDAGKRRTITAVAVSKTQSPLDGWYLYWWDAVNDFGNPGGGVYQAGDLAEEPFLGISQTAIHQANGVLNGGVARYWRITFFPAQLMANGAAAPILGWQYGDLKNPNGTTPWMVQPVVHHGPTSSRVFYAGRQGSSQAVVWSISSPLQAGQSISRVAVTMPEAWNKPVNAPQNGSAELIAMTRLSNAVLKATYRGGWLHLVTNDAANWFGDGLLSSIRLVRMDVSSYPSIPTSGGFINRRFGQNNSNEDDPEARIHYAWPSIAVNASGHMVVAYSRSGVSLYPEARFSAYKNGASDILASRTLKAGEAPYDQPLGASAVLPWGETAGATVDPFDSDSIWMAHQYASTNPSIAGNHDIWVGKVFGQQNVDINIAAIREESDPPTGGGGMPWDIVYTIRNEGDGLADVVPTAVYLVSAEGRRIELSATEHRGLPPGQQTTVRETLTIPSDTPAGRYELRLVVDPANRFHEYSETNNVDSMPFEVTAEAGR